jgi:hypothetical protein
MGNDNKEREILLVGSVGLASAEEVFRTAAGMFGGRLRRIPDGETGQRAVWVIWNREVFADNPAFEPDPEEVAAGGRITSEVEGTRRWGGGGQIAEGAPPPARLRIRDGFPAQDLAIGPLGYVDHAVDSYATFRRLRDAGAIGAGTRFQVSLPTAAAALNAHVAPASHHLAERPMVARLLQEVDEICDAVPHQDLSIQWDVSTEMGQWEGVRFAWFEDVQAGVIARLALHCARIPDAVELGIHLCYGSYGNRHWMEPADTANCVAVFNAVAGQVERPIQWVHMPVPVARDDDAYYAPLRDLRLAPGTTLYLGLIHLGDGAEGARRRIAAAEKFAPAFGIATECGFGRRPPETIPDLLRVHTEI